MERAITFLICVLTLHSSHVNGLNCFVGIKSLEEKVCPQIATHCVRRERQIVPECKLGREELTEYVIDAGCGNESFCTEENCEKVSFLDDYSRMSKEEEIKEGSKVLTCSRKCNRTDNSNGGSKQVLDPLSVLEQPAFPPAKDDACPEGFQVSPKGGTKYRMVSCPKKSNMVCVRHEVGVRTEKTHVDFPLNFIFGKCANVSSTVNCKESVKNFVRKRLKIHRYFYGFCSIPSSEFTVTSCNVSYSNKNRCAQVEEYLPIQNEKEYDDDFPEGNAENLKHEKLVIFLFWMASIAFGRIFY